MSKTSQRKRSQYELGKQDAKTGRGFRWIKHQYINSYKAGFNSVKKKPLKKSLWRLVLQRLKIFIGRGKENI